MSNVNKPVNSYGGYPFIRPGHLFADKICFVTPTFAPPASTVMEPRIRSEVSGKARLLEWMHDKFYRHTANGYCVRFILAPWLKLFTMQVYNNKSDVKEELRAKKAVDAVFIVRNRGRDVGRWQ